MKETEEHLLVMPDREHFAELAACREEFLAAHSSMDGSSSLAETPDLTTWLRRTENLRRAEHLPPHLVPTTQLLYVRASDGRVLGFLQARHYCNEYYEEYGGHISFSVRPSERGRGVAKAMLRQCLPFCRGIGLESVELCCPADHAAARRVILDTGGVLDSTVPAPEGGGMLERYWIDIWMVMGKDDFAAQ